MIESLEMHFHRVALSVILTFAMLVLLIFTYAIIIVRGHYCRDLIIAQRINIWL